MRAGRTLVPTCSSVAPRARAAMRGGPSSVCDLEAPLPPRPGIVIVAAAWRALARAPHGHCASASTRAHTRGDDGRHRAGHCDDMGPKMAQPGVSLAHELELGMLRAPSGLGLVQHLKSTHRSGSPENPGGRRAATEAPGRRGREDAFAMGRPHTLRDGCAAVPHTVRPRSPSGIATQDPVRTTWSNQSQIRTWPPRSWSSPTQVWPKQPARAARVHSVEEAGAGGGLGALHYIAQ